MKLREGIYFLLPAITLLLSAMTFFLAFGLGKDKLANVMFWSVPVLLAILIITISFKRKDRS